jgi:uncharacterized protein
MKPYKRIRVFPERDLRATRLEMAVIDCRIVQRLRDVKQLGQSVVAFPTAEHSRFSHSLGALYWSAKMISYLRENDFSEGERGNESQLEMANATLKRTVLLGLPTEKFLSYPISWFDQLIRLAALLHDISHLPYGHTLEDQAGLLPRHDEDPERINYIFDRLREELQDSPHLNCEDGPQLLEILLRLIHHCRIFYAIGEMLKGESGPKEVKKGTNEIHKVIESIDKEFLPYLVLVYDIVNNTICADLIDYLHRDTLQCGMPWTLDKALFSNLKILKKAPPHNADYFRFGVTVGRNGKLRHDVVTAVLALLRARYDVTEKVYYHHTKCSADAMLEKAIRGSGISLSWKTILDDDLGDEGLMHRLAAQLTEKPEPLAVLKALRSRRFYKPIYRLRRTGDWSAKTRAAVSLCKPPLGRTEMESQLAKVCKTSDSAIIVSCLPEKMQLKEAHALIEWTDGEVLTLAELPGRKAYLPEVESLTKRYYELWSLTVYIEQSMGNHASNVEAACEKAFNHKNDPLMAEYIRAKYSKAFEAKEILDNFMQDTESALINDLNVAFQGGSPEQERNLEEVVIDHIENLLVDRKSTLQASRVVRDDNQPDLFETKEATAEEDIIDVSENLVPSEDPEG